jgi:hypothetical protein
VSAPTSDGLAMQPERSVPPVGGPAPQPDGTRLDETAQHGVWQDGDERRGGSDQGGEQEAQTAAG